MSTALAKIDEGSLESKVELIKRTVAVGATDDELALFMHQVKKTGLDPLARQIYFIKRQGKGTIQTGIDGYRLVAERTGNYAGNDDPVFQELEGAANPLKATVTVWKIVAGKRCPFTASAIWREYYPGDAQGWAWKKMPHVMLGKVAEALALRKAFPAELSGVYTHDEMAQAEHPNTLVGCCGKCGKETPWDVVTCDECLAERKKLQAGAADAPESKPQSVSGVTSESAPVAPTLSELRAKVIKQSTSKGKVFWELEGKVLLWSPLRSGEEAPAITGRTIECTAIAEGIKRGFQSFRLEELIHVSQPDPLEVQESDMVPVLEASLKAEAAKKKLADKTEDIPF